MSIHDLVKLLVCPVCKGQLEADDDVLRLTCRPCGLAFPIRDGIPVMLPDQAERCQSHGAGDTER